MEGMEMEVTLLTFYQTCDVHVMGSLIALPETHPRQFIQKVFLNNRVTRIERIALTIVVLLKCTITILSNFSIVFKRNYTAL